MKRNGLLVMVCALSAIALADAATALADEPTASHGYLVVADGLKMHYVVLGHGTGVVLIHGAGGSAESWFKNGIAPALAKTHRVVVVDCRGHGLSEDPPGGSMPNRTMAQDVFELMDHLGIPKAHVHGYSMGGAIAEQMLARHPERLLSVAFGGWGIPETDPPMQAKVPPDKEGADPVEKELYAKFRERLAQRKPVPSSQNKETNTPAPKRGKGGDDASRPKLDLTKITLGVLAINGEFDRPNVKTHRMQRELADFKSVVLPGKSHMSAIAAGSMPPQYLEALAEFINAHDPQ
jgi:pimeloyl-ACP methyl ester carboxylesterase